MKRFKLNEYTQERVEVYKKAPEFWVGQLAKQKDEHFVAMFVGYMNTDKTLKEVGRENGVSLERVRQIVQEGLRVIFRQSKIPSVSKVLEAYMTKAPVKKRAGNPTASPLTQEEFDEIKELLFRGESNSDIAQLVGRSISVVGRVARNETLEAYFKNNYNHVLRKKRSFAPEVKEVLTTATQEQFPTSRAGRATKMQEKILDAVAEFVTGEVGEVVASNEQLRAENEALRLELEKKKPDFLKMLGDRLARHN